MAHVREIQEKRALVGFIRSDTGKWIVQFYKSYHRSTNNHMEMVAINEGRKIVEQRNPLPIEINIDSAEVISMLAIGNLYYDALQVKTKKAREPRGVSLL